MASSEDILPFYIAASTVGVGAITRLSPGGPDNPQELELHVISGGPVFLWIGREEVRDTYIQSHGASSDQMNFEIAANIYCPGKLRVEAALPLVTLASDNETVGYLKVKS